MTDDPTVPAPEVPDVVQYLDALVGSFGPDEDVEFAAGTWRRIHAQLIIAANRLRLAAPEVTKDASR